MDYESNKSISSVGCVRRQKYFAVKDIEQSVVTHHFIYFMPLEVGCIRRKKYLTMKGIEQSVVTHHFYLLLLGFLRQPNLRLFIPLKTAN